MKKNILGLAAILLAVSLSAFTHVKPNISKNLTTYYWYDLSGAPFNLGVKADEPNSECTSAGTDCARGFTNIPTNPVTDPAQAFRGHNTH